MLVIDGPFRTRLLVDPYYDANYKLYGTVLFSPTELQTFALNRSGQFDVFRQVICNELKLPATGEVVPVQFWETGKMHYGTSNPDDPAYDSLADFRAGIGFVEIRIPWMLLNFADPSSGKILANVHTEGAFTFETIQELYLGVGKADGAGLVYMSAWRVPAWGRFSYTEYTKLAYAALQKAFPLYATYPLGKGEALGAALKLRDTRMLYIRIDQRLRNTDLIGFFLVLLIMLVVYLYILLLAVNYRLNRIHNRQEREREHLRSQMNLPEEKLRKKIHRRYLCSPKGAELLCRFLIEENLTDSGLPLLSVLSTGKFRIWMRRVLSSRDLMLCILVIRLIGLLRISRFQQRIVELMRLHTQNLDLQYAGLLALAMIGSRESIAQLCSEPNITKLLSYRSLKEIFANYAGPDKRELYEQLLDSPDPYILRIIVKNIGEEGFTELADRLLAFLAGGDQNLLCDVVRSLGQLRCAQAGPRIAPFMKSESWTLRNVTAVALAQIDARGYLPQLVEALRDREWWVRYNSAHELCAHLPLEELQRALPLLDDRFARDILQFAIQETRLMGREAKPV